MHRNSSGQLLLRLRQLQWLAAREGCQAVPVKYLDASLPADI